MHEPELFCRLSLRSAAAAQRRRSIRKIDDFADHKSEPAKSEFHSSELFPGESRQKEGYMMRSTASFTVSSASTPSITKRTNFAPFISASLEPMKPPVTEQITAGIASA